MSTDARNGINSIPVADPNAGFVAAVDAAIEQLRRAFTIARENGVSITAEQDRTVRSILTP